MNDAHMGAIDISPHDLGQQIQDSADHPLRHAEENENTLMEFD